MSKLKGAAGRPILEKIAKTYGLDSWDQIQAIRYTQNVQLGAVNIAHSWEWEPKTGKVSYEGKDKDAGTNPATVTYSPTILLVCPRQEPPLPPAIIVLLLGVSSELIPQICEPLISTQRLFRWFQTGLTFPAIDGISPATPGQRGTAA